MLTTVEAEIDVDGSVRLLEPLKLLRKSRAIVTVLDKTNGNSEKDSNKNSIIELLNNPGFANRKSYSAEEIEAQIEELRNSWK